MACRDATRRDTPPTRFLTVYSNVARLLPVSLYALAYLSGYFLHIEHEREGDDDDDDEKERDHKQMTQAL